MKNLILFSFIFAVLVYADAPWIPNIRVSVEEPWDTLDQGESCFDLWGDSIYAVCNTAQRGQVPNAPWAWSFDAGQTFSQEPFIDWNAGIGWHSDPLVGVDDSGHVHLLIQFSTSFMNHYFSTDGGQTWSDTSRINASSGVDKPWWVINRNEIYVVWQQVSGFQGIHLAKSTNYGRSFSDTRIWTRRGITALCMDENENLHLGNVVWGDGIYYRKSTDKGTTWSSEQRLSSYSYTTSYGDRAPINSIAATGNVVLITWVGNMPNGSWEVNGVRSTDGGASWSSRYVINDITAGGQCKAFAHFDSYGGLHVYYYHTPDWPTNSSSIFSIRYQYSPDSGATFNSSHRVTDTQWTSHADFLGEYHILDSDSQYIYAIWADGRNPGDNDLYFSKALLTEVSAQEYRAESFGSGRIISMPTIWNGNVVMNISSHPHPIEINAYDVSGRMIKQIYAGQVTTPTKLSVKSNDLPAGVVFIKVNSREILEVTKIINIKSR
jgi:hypothetical protein